MVMKASTVNDDKPGISGDISNQWREGNFMVLFASAGVHKSRFRGRRKSATIALRSVQTRVDLDSGSKEVAKTRIEE